MDVVYLDHMGTDLTVVNAARVSFHKESHAEAWEQLPWEVEQRLFPNHLFQIPTLTARDKKLLSYLARESHVLPFRHPQTTLHIKAPIFVARQLVKHQVGMSWSEVSRRYVTEAPEFYIPETWRKAAKDKKQGSSDELVEDIDYDGDIYGINFAIKDGMEVLRNLYTSLLEAEVAPEMARMVLPQNMYTEWVWTGSLLAWANMCKLRQAPDTQAETRIIADKIAEIISTIYPNSWSALNNVAVQEKEES